MDNVLPPIPPKEHDFSQQSLSSLRSVTVTTSNKSNGGAGGCTDNNTAGSQNSQLSNINSQLSNPNSQVSGPKLEVLESQQSQSQLSNPSQSNSLKIMPTSNNNNSTNHNNSTNNNGINNSNINNNGNYKTAERDDNDDQEEEEEEEANTQETYTQQILTQGQELTQLGFDDDNLDMNDTQSQDGIHSPTPIDPLTLPWGRLMPVGLNEEEGMPPAGGGRDYNNNGGRDYNNRPNSSRGAKEMLPRSPIRSGSSITRSRSPSPSRKSNGERDDSFSQSPTTPHVNFLGLKNLLPSDRFNEYILGRSVKADVSAQKLDVPPPIQSESNANIEELEQRANAKRKRHDYVHAMISNRHCKVYCLLSGTIGNNNKSNNKSSSSPSPPEMEVFVEDTSGNGTLINGTTLLRRNERRKLHTGDVICLLNPKLLSKKLRSVAERKMYMSQYSYVFVNLYEQEARHGWGVNSMLSNSMSRSSFSGGGGRMSNLSGSSPGRSTTKKKGAVNPRATKCHSLHTKGKRSLFSTAAAGGGKKVPLHQLSSSRKNNGGRSSLGSFLNKSNLPTSNNNTISTSSQRRRVEEEYDLRDLLGTGTCGEVRRAIHRRTGEERAIKIISIGGRNAQMPGMSTEKLSSIQAEAQILRSLDHPYIVKLFDMYISPGKAIYLVMELIKGGDLFDRIVEKERYTEVQARRLFRRILTAVYYLHEERGIVHRDLKPENILVVDRRNDINIKLTDFGLAKNMTAEGLKTFCGTPQYFAPEVLRRRHTVKGDGRYGKEIDCWSIGVILFILLSGSPPFDVSAGFDAVANAKVAFYDDQWKHVSSEARDLVMRLLEKDPRKRMSVRDACRHAWVLVNDGDTHCHPLHDPIVANVSGSDAMIAVASKDIAEARNDNEQKTNTSQQDDEPASDVPSKPQSNPPSSQERQICAPVDANALSPKPNAVEQNTRKPATANQRFQSMSAPQLSKDERKPSIWPVNQNDKVATKAIQQACEDSQPSPNGSPIKKKQLFNESAAAAAAKASNNSNFTDTTKKMTKQGVESIKAAGNTLPTPVISKESHLIKKVAAPKKKIQSTLFPTADISKQQAKTTFTKPPAVQPQVPNGQDNQTKKRKAIDLKSMGTPSVTPPGTESNTNNVGLVFQLNKKIKVGGKKKNVSPGQQAESSTATAPEKKKKAELSEDELESDFSDDEGESLSKSPMKTDKKPLEKYLQKRKMESIESTASAAIGKKKPQSTQECDSYQGQTKSSQDSSQESRRVSKSPQNPLKSDEGEMPNNNNSTTTTKGKERKMKQSYLFGKPPPANNELPNDTEASNDIPTAADEDEDTKAVETQKMQIDGEVELERQPTTESNGSGNSSTSVPKGKQRSIKSWFAPKN